jgi:hypothetical protein
MFRKMLACLFSLAFFTLLAWTQEPPPIDPAKAALIEEMMSLTHPDKMLTQFLQQYKQAFSKGLEDSFRNQLQKRHFQNRNWPTSSPFTKRHPAKVSCKNHQRY